MVVYFFMEVESIFYKSLGSDDLVRCELCSRFCVISNGDVGFCARPEFLVKSLFKLPYIVVSPCTFSLKLSLSARSVEICLLYY